MIILLVILMAVLTVAVVAFVATYLVMLRGIWPFMKEAMDLYRKILPSLKKQMEEDFGE